MQSLSEIIQPLKKRRGASVRRNSRAAGREGVFWRPTTRQETRQIVLAARRFDMAARPFGSRNGPLGHIALEVLDLLANMVSFRTGQLDPALETIAAKLNRSKSAIVEALKALRRHGFLDWLRRYEPTGNEGRGPQVRQTSNAYRLVLPAIARRLLGRYGMPAPAPDDFTHAQEQHAAMIEAHKATLTGEQLALFEIENPRLAAALAGLARGIARDKERESAKRSESQSSFNLYAESASPMLS